MGNPNNTVRFSIIHFATTTTLIHRLENDPLNSEVPQDHTAVVATLNGLCYTSGGLTCRALFSQRIDIQR